MEFIGTVFMSLADDYSVLILQKGGQHPNMIDKTDRQFSGETLVCWEEVKDVDCTWVSAWAHKGVTAIPKEQSRLIQGGKGEMNAITQDRSRIDGKDRQRCSSGISDSTLQICQGGLPSIGLTGFATGEVSSTQPSITLQCLDLTSRQSGVAPRIMLQ